jgi:hypothetical protein
MRCVEDFARFIAISNVSAPSLVHAVFKMGKCALLLVAVDRASRILSIDCATRQGKAVERQTGGRRSLFLVAVSGS